MKSSSPRIIGFTAGMGVGKSTAVHHIQSYFGPGMAPVVKFAAALYELQEMIYKRLEPVYVRPEDFIKDRKLLQFLGTEFGRGLDQNLWIKMWAEKIGSFEYADKPIILVDDVRFNGEAEAIHDLGGMVVKIVGPTRIEDSGIKAHASEAGISSDLVDLVINNNHSIEEFKQSVATLLLGQ